MSEKVTAYAKHRFWSLAAPIAAIFSAAAASPATRVTDDGPPPRIALGAIEKHLEIPAFSRLYGTACSTCHTAAPKLNSFGEVFRLNGYRMPESLLIDREDDPVSLGAPEWDEAWPRSIRSSDIPGIVPLAVRVVSDAQITRDERVPYDLTYMFPEAVHLLAGTPLGDGLAAFVDVGWERGEGLSVHQARIEFQDPLPWVPERLLSLRLGVQDPYLLTFGHQHVDRVTRVPFLWQSFEASEVGLVDSRAGEPIGADNRLSLGRSQPAVELDGILGGRFQFGVGLSQGLGDDGVDRNGRKDLYYKVRYKAGGMDFRGFYDSERIPSQTMSGQLLDRAVVIEHFGYFGSETTNDAPQGDHTAFGVAVRAILGRVDAGAGYVVRDFARPWTEFPDGHLKTESLFARAEYLVLPWVITSLRAERLDIVIDDLPPDVSIASSPSESTRMLPGVALLLRQNVRLAVEGELFLRQTDTHTAELPLPHSLWMRLDVAF